MDSTFSTKTGFGSDTDNIFQKQDRTGLQKSTIRSSLIFATGYCRRMKGNHRNRQEESDIVAIRVAEREELNVFGGSRIPNNTGSRSRIFLSDSNSGCPIEALFKSHC